MDFFEHQQRARRRTMLLVVCFITAVVCIVAAVNLVYVLAFEAMSNDWTQPAGWIELPADAPGRELLRPGRRSARPPGTHFVWLTLGTLGVIAGGSLYRTAELGRGGAAVAQMLGGRPLAPNATEASERRLQNVVEEMAVASGVPVPAVYLLEQERGINAFAAGLSLGDAVIGVTRGTVEKLSRDELQGVVAHEYSHILNGDMRMNVRLIGLLHGILMIAVLGRGAMRATVMGRRSRNDGGGRLAMLVVGLALLLIGGIGVLFGRLIQAAVSRQREFLADASAVQFTRNPHGIAGALKKIGGYSAGSRLEHQNAMETAHLFFARGVGKSLTRLMATHPPLTERIRKIDPTFAGVFPSEPAEERVPEQARPGVAAFSDDGAGRRLRLDSREMLEQIGRPSPAHIRHAAMLISGLPDELKDAAHEPFSARAVVFCLLINREAAPRQAQLEMLRRDPDSVVCEEVRRLAPAIERLGPEARLPLLDMVLPALRQLSPAQGRDFRTMLEALIHADQRVTLSEYALYEIVKRTLESPARRPVRYHAVRPLRDAAAVLLSALARADGKGEGEAAEAYAQAAHRLELPSIAPGRPPLEEIDTALDQLAGGSPGVRRRIMDACAHCVAVDGYVSVEEGELLRAVATILESPLPPLLAGSAEGAPAPASSSRT